MKKFPIARIPVLVLSIFGTVLIIAAVTLLLKLSVNALQIQIIALLYLLPILLCTILWGLTTGILAGLLAFLAFNFFFIQPYYTLRVHHSQDLISLTIFLIVAVVVSQFVGQARQATRLAKKREREATCMYELISALAGLTEIPDVMQVLADHLLEMFHIDQVEIVANDRITASTLIHRAPLAQDKPEPCDMLASMHTARNIEGEIKLWLDQNNLSVEESRLLAAFANQGALAIERIHFFKQENRARLLEESDRIKTSLLNSVSHELRSPLAAIKASASSLLSGTVDWDSEARKELLSTIEEETDQLNLLVGNLLDMSRIEAGALQPKMQWNSIIEIIKGVASQMRMKLEHHKMLYDFDLNLPLVPSDYLMMGQVFTNLFSNCVKYAPQGTPIKVIGIRDEAGVWIRIINQSPPVPEEHIAHIFDKFHRVTKADQVTGTGLGLSICKGIVEAHGGKIWAENRSEGFVFNLRLPITLDGTLPLIPKDELDG